MKRFMLTLSAVVLTLSLSAMAQAATGLARARLDTFATGLHSRPPARIKCRKGAQFPSADAAGVDQRQRFPMKILVVDDDPELLVAAVDTAGMPELRPQLYGDGHAAERIAAALYASRPK